MQHLQHLSGSKEECHRLSLIICGILRLGTIVTLRACQVTYRTLGCPRWEQLKSVGKEACKTPALSRPSLSRRIGSSRMLAVGWSCGRKASGRGKCSHSQTRDYQTSKAYYDDYTDVPGSLARARSRKSEVTLPNSHNCDFIHIMIDPIPMP